MSTIIVKSVKAETYSKLGRYFYVELANGKHELTIAIAPEHVQVIVENASNRAWRGMGKRFNNKAEALAAYKTAAIRDMIEHAHELNTLALAPTGVAS